MWSTVLQRAIGAKPTAIVEDDAEIRLVAQADPSAASTAAPSPLVVRARGTRFSSSPVTLSNPFDHANPTSDVRVTVTSRTPLRFAASVHLTLKNPTAPLATSQLFTPKGAPDITPAEIKLFNQQVVAVSRASLSDHQLVLDYTPPNGQTVPQMLPIVHAMGNDMLRAATNLPPHATDATAVLTKASALAIALG